MTRTTRKSFFATLLFVLISTLFSASYVTPASAITFGELVTDPKSDAGWVVSIWDATSLDGKKNFICTGSLIEPTVVMTAAHCLTGTSHLFVKVGAKTLNDNTEFTAATNSMPLPKYSPKFLIADLGFIHLARAFNDVSLPSIVGPENANLASLSRPLTMFGWGLDQDKQNTQLLRSADLDLQDQAAPKYYGKYFSKTFMMAAGRMIPTEKAYAGGCTGDAGAPLVVSVSGMTTIVGVASWNSKDCRVSAPTVFARASYYSGEIKKSVSDVISISSAIDTSPAVQISDAAIRGTMATDSQLTCDSGTWRNAKKVSIKWTSPARIAGSTVPTITIRSTDSGETFACDVTVVSAAGVQTQSVDAVMKPAPVMSGNVIITGARTNQYLYSGMTLHASGWWWYEPIDQERVQWFLTTAPNSPMQYTGSLVGVGSNLLLTRDLLYAASGQFLVAQVTGIRGGSAVFDSAAFYVNPNLVIG